MSGDPEKSAAGYRMLYRMFAHSTGLHPTVNAHDSTEGIAIPRLRIPEAMMHEKFEWRGKGFCGPSIQSQMQKYQYPAPGYPFVTMYWRYGGSFFGTMQQTNRYVKAYREGRRAHRGQPVHLDGGRGQVRRHHPAGLHQLRALGHERVRQLLGLHPGQPQPDQPPGDRLPEEVHRAARREQVGLRHLRRRRRAHGHGRRLHRGRHGRARLVQGVLRRHRPAHRSPPGSEFEKKGYVVVPFPDDYKSTPAMRWFAEGRKRDTPDWGPRPGDTVGFKGLQTPSGKIEFVEQDAQEPRDGRHRPRAAGHGPAVHRQLGGPPHHRAVRQVPAADGEPAPALQLPHHGRLQGHAGSTRSRSTASCTRTATATGSCA